MGYDIRKWRERLAERVDLSSQVIHLTRLKKKGEKSIDNLKSIVRDRTILGSGKSGYIIGDQPAVCFQDAPLYAACQNCYFEQKNRKSFPDAKMRYSPIGIMFPKDYVYAKGGRPVFYEKTEIAKEMLPKNNWWRIVNFDLSDNKNIVDWTHEREWRCPGDFEFDIKKSTLLFLNDRHYKKFLKWDLNQEEPVYDQVKSVVILSDILY